MGAIDALKLGSGAVVQLLRVRVVDCGAASFQAAGAAAAAAAAVIPRHGGGSGSGRITS